MQTFSRYIWISCLALVHLPTSRDLNFTRDQTRIGKRFLPSPLFPPIMILRSCDSISMRRSKRSNESSRSSRMRNWNISITRGLNLEKKRFFSRFSISIRPRIREAKPFQRSDSARMIPEIGVEIIEIGIKCEMGRSAGHRDSWYAHNTRLHAGKIISSRP